MKRYEHGDDMRVVESTDGNWVKWDDVAALLDRIAESTPDPAVHRLLREAEET